jgi:hypothetical protein
MNKNQCFIIQARIRDYLSLLIVEYHCVSDSSLLGSKFSKEFLRLKNFEDKLKMSNELLADRDFKTVLHMAISSLANLSKYTRN